MQYILSIPLKVLLPNGKLVPINKNVERNQHFYLKNQVKQAFLDNHKHKLNKLPVFKGQISISYVLYKANKRRVDLDNVLSMCSKYLGDSLVSCGRIPDDNTDYIISHHYYYGGISKEYPRIVILIKEV